MLVGGASVTGRALLIVLTAILLIGGSWAAAHWTAPLDRWVGGLIVGGILLAALLALTTWRARGLRPHLSGLVLIAGIAILARLPLIQTDQWLSDDAARYHWDGKVIAHGINPYTFAPSDPQLAPLRDSNLDERINHPDELTVYPPVAEGIFLLAYVLTPGDLLGLKLMALLAEIATWLLLWRLLARWDLPPGNLLWVAWAPLLLIEGYLPGHADIFLLPLLVLFAGALMDCHTWRTGLWLALASLIKPFPLILLPAVLQHLGRRRAGRCLAVMVAVALIAYAPFLSAGEGLIRSMLLMYRTWSFNGSLARLLEAVLPVETAHVLLAGLLGLALVVSLRWRGDLLARIQWAQIAWIICTPALFPWYLIWVLPFMALRFNAALMALTILVITAEEVVVGYRATGVWCGALWPSLLAYGSFGLLMLVPRLKLSRRRRGVGTWRRRRTA